MRNSWLALAMKSARMRSTRRDSVRSRKVSSVATTSPASVASGATQTSNSRSIGTRSLHSAVSASPRRRRRGGSRRCTSGERSASTSGSPTRSAGSSATRGLVGGDRAPVGVDDDRRLRHRADQLARRSAERICASSSRWRESRALIAGHPQSRAAADQSPIVELCWFPSPRARSASAAPPRCAPSSASASRNGTT